jgi:Mg-chelatase subunit ChlD
MWKTAGALVAGAFASISLASCQTYDFEPVEPAAFQVETGRFEGFARALKPNVLLVVDKSASMLRTDPGVTGTRLTNLKAAMKTFFEESAGAARYGFAVFPNVTSPPATSAAACVAGRLVTDVNVGTDDAAAQLQVARSINDAIQGINEQGSDLPAIGGTPTAATLRAIGSAAGVQVGTGAGEATRARFVLLLTDGIPNCNSSLDRATCTCLDPGWTPGTACSVPENCLDNTASVEAVTALKAAGVTTIVVGFGNEVVAGAPTLTAMAQAGGFQTQCTSNTDCGTAGACAKAPGAGATDTGVCPVRYFQAANANELSTALRAITESLPVDDPCLYEFSIRPPDPKLISVTIDGQLVTQGNNTWAYRDTVTEGRETGEVALIGDTCTRVLAATPANPVQIKVTVVRPR